MNFSLANHLKSGTITWSRNREKTGSIPIEVNIQDKYIRFYYTSTDNETQESKDRDYRVRLETNTCTFGGVRYWFNCAFCNKRVGVLYLYGKNDFACRHCLNLSYQIRNKPSRYRDFQKLFDYEKVEGEIWRLKTKYYNGVPTIKYR